ncbi:NAD(P)-dependent oxidoreductase [Bradyrhizobium sp. 179]|uniref:NAD(P)-dependent oxidoreductase n=1 Tax=Bradyrhizobium sp. 179 TaxID=2782648 RepID=UPI001FF85F62|nr:NAD(P)-dependent oxidoreductase [Bradyrhizobium sp. 179]MCK1546166.1 NAD(P)-dependent oxidoreductase [Bradyrhizobium sp. 179]
MKIGFAGLGQMGRPIALNLLKSGATLAVTDRSSKWFAEFQSKGAGASAEQATIFDADVVFLCLPHDNAVEDVVAGEAGFLTRARAGQILIDLSTITYKKTVSVADKLASRGVQFLDAPISGMEARAIDGTLTVMCGGDRAVFDKAKPLLDLIGNKILYMGGPGSGQLTKLINQLLFDINAAALAEILPMSKKMGLDPDLVGEVVNSGTGRSYASEFFIPRILRRHFGDGYPMKHAYKDLISGAELGANLSIPMPVLAAATATYQMALLKGHGDKDKGGMVTVFEELLGVDYRSQEGASAKSGEK